MMNAAQLGRGLPATATAGMGGAGVGYANLANMQANAAKGTWDAVGGGIGNMMQMYLMANRMSPAASGGSAGGGWWDTQMRDISQPAYISI